MKIISHRGNITGRKIDRENAPSYIDSAISSGYEVEVDIRYIKGSFWLGHDFAAFEVSDTWIKKRKNLLWFHCKDLESAIALSNVDEKITYFCHANDPYTVISNGFIWVHELSYAVNNKCIIPLLTESSIHDGNLYEAGGICTDFVNIANTIWTN